VYTICLVNAPQVAAAFLLLPMYWNEPAYCDEVTSERWRWWVLLSALRMFFFSGPVWILYAYRDWLATRQDTTNRLIIVRNIADVVGTIWFIFGNM
jgi:hypothetical protein